jgi:hypothetical protein
VRTTRVDGLGAVHLLEDVARAVHGRFDEIPLRIRHVDLERRGDVEDGAAAGHRLREGALLGEVRREELQAPLRALDEAVEVGEALGLARVTDGAVDGQTLLEESLDDPSGDVAGGPGDEDGDGAIDLKLGHAAFSCARST